MPGAAGGSVGLGVAVAGLRVGLAARVGVLVGVPLGVAVGVCVRVAVVSAVAAEVGVVLASSVPIPGETAVDTPVAVRVTVAVGASVDVVSADRLGVVVAPAWELPPVGVGEAGVVAVDDGRAVGNGLAVGSAESVPMADGDGLGRAAHTEVASAVSVPALGPAAEAGDVEPGLNITGRSIRKSPAISTTADAAIVAMAQTGSRGWDWTPRQGRAVDLSTTPSVSATL